MSFEEVAELITKRVCHECIGEEYLSNEVADTGVVGKCDYCDQSTHSWGLEQLTQRIEVAFEHHYVRTADQPDSWEERLMADRELSYEWYRDGQPTNEAIQEAAGIGHEVAVDVQAILDDKYGSHDPSDGFDESEFSAECHYDLRGASDRAWQEAWNNFERAIQTEARFFSRSAAAHLADVFGNIDSIRTNNGQPLVLNVGPQLALEHLYRARVFQSEDQLLKALCWPVPELGPPPARIASAGRMNAQGISVFYGATSIQSAISEVRPPVGSRVAVAKFKIVRPLRLLDLTALEYAHADGSIFDLTLKDRLERVAFLQSLGKHMTRAVMPDDQALDYLATQAIADFLATENEPAFDGIVYRSAQAQEGCNVVLFHKASKVQAMSVPAGARVTASPGYPTEEGYEPDYSVYEEVPAAALDDLSRGGAFVDDRLSVGPDDFQGLDVREDTLCVDTDSLEVHSVGWVQVHCEPFPVARHRFERSAHQGDDF